MGGWAGGLVGGCVGGLSYTLFVHNLLTHLCPSSEMYCPGIPNSEPEFYGDLVYKLNKIFVFNNFSTQFN